MYLIVERKSANSHIRMELDEEVALRQIQYLHWSVFRPKIVMGDIVSFERLDDRGEWVRVE